MLKYILLLFCLFILSQPATSQSRLDSLEQRILHLEANVESVHLNLEMSKNRFQSGILVATLGYTITIAGGLMLGRERDQLGQVLLITGGATGAAGTFMLVDAFKFLGRTRKRPAP